MKNFNKYISIYKEQLEKGEIQKAYTGLIKYVMKLRAVFANKLSDKFSFGNILQGYMDYTYFYFSNEQLKKKKLKFGLVLNHQEMRFEIWLLGNTISVQRIYWELLKATELNKNKKEMPQYSVLETILVRNPDFNNLDLLAQQIENAMIYESDEIINYIEKIN